VTLQEFAVLPAVATAASGDITFVVTNSGPHDIHEFVVIRTDLAPDALPTDSRGAVDEEREGMTVIDEIEDLEVGATESVTVTLDPGAYVLICNIYDEDEQEAHYQMGMYTGFTVTE
jgi:plastocyanin